MKQIKIIKSPSFEELKENIGYYANMFISEGVIALRNANFSNDEQYLINEQIGNVLNWYPKTDSKEKGRIHYQENHSRMYKHNPERTDKDKLILLWHMEHTDYKNPIVGATWNMYLFNTDPSNGRTAFVDTSEIYKKMPDDWKKFLSNCIEIISKNSRIGDSDEEFAWKEFEIPCVQKHWFNDEPTIRIDLDSKDNRLGIKFIDNKEVTKEDLILFQKIKNYVFSEIYDNKDNLLYHEWNQGDMIIVDLFKMAHAVYGGFLPEEREFSGYWAYKEEITDQW
jgi:alpha-ketoglutarate-dependent taurine dioxygenase